jgi:hypothetical protein
MEKAETMSITSLAATEFEAIKTVHGALEPLEPEARRRVLGYIASLLEIETTKATPSFKKGDEQPVEEEEEAAPEAAKGAKGAKVYGSFAELYAAANPGSNGEKALVAGYWLQVCGGAENFTAAAAQKELTHLGHGVSNITDAIDSMKGQKPQLILQLKKSGTSKQARKLYKVSFEGVNRVRALISG